MQRKAPKPSKKLKKKFKKFGVIGNEMKLDPIPEIKQAHTTMSKRWAPKSINLAHVWPR